MNKKNPHYSVSKKKPQNAWVGQPASSNFQSLFTESSDERK